MLTVYLLNFQHSAQTYKYHQGPRFSEESKIIDFIQNTDAIGYAVSAGKKFLRSFLIRTYAEDKAPNLLSPGSLILNLRFVKKSIVRQM